MPFRPALVLLLLAVACKSQTLSTPRADGTPHAAVTLDVSDVSVLYPLPKTWKEADKLLLGTKQQREQLLPRALFDKIDPLLQVGPQGPTPDQIYASLRVVGVRIDPCFPSLALDPSACRRQVRLVVQPFLKPAVPQGAPEPAVTTTDAALHVFFDLDEAAFKALAQALAARRAAAGVPAVKALAVHPVLAAEGVDGSYAKDFAALILANATTTRLSKITFMLLRGKNNVWEFGGFDVEGGVMKPAPIPGQTELRQSFSNAAHIENPPVFRASVSPAIAMQDDVSALFDSDAVLSGETTAEQVKGALDVAHRLENPDRGHDPSKTDCVSCHVATIARVWAEGHGFGGADNAFQYQNAAWDLALNSEVKGKTGAMRAFGYVGALVALSQRTVNESAAVADFVNANVLP